MLPLSRKDFRLPIPGSIVPKVVIAILALTILYQLHAHQAFQLLQNPESQSVPTTLYDNHAATGGEVSEGWFQNARKAHQAAVDDEEDDLAEDPVRSSDSTKTPPLQNVSPMSDDITALDYDRTFVSYGETKCLPPFDEKMKRDAIARYVSCTHFAPFYPKETRRVAFASISTGKTEEGYERAIQSQMFHSAVHGSSTHVLCETLSEGAWNKIAFLLNLLMNEMLKPEEARLEWIMWADRDAIVMDACRPLSHFIPPETPEYDAINLVTNEDAFGLNAGVFLFRVNEWSISFFSTVLAYPQYKPDEQLVFAEQSAMWNVMREPAWTNATVRVPWYWFNAYPVEGGSTESYKTGENPSEYFRARKGDFMVHFAGHPGRGKEMPEWEDMLQDIGNVWQRGNVQRDVTQEIQEYWKSWAKGTLTDAQKSGEPEKTD